MLPLALRSPLTERQEELLQLLADGLRQKEAAHRLGITPQTVKNMLHGHAGYRGIGEKLGKNSTTAMVAEALRHGWIV